MHGVDGSIRASLRLAGRRGVISGVTVDMGISGALLQSFHKAEVGEEGILVIDVGERLEVPVRVFRVDQETYKPFFGIGLEFAELSDEQKVALQERSAWKVRKTDRECRVVLRTGFTEAVTFAALLDELEGDVSMVVTIDLSGVRQVSSIGVRKWVRFLEELGPDRRVAFVRCSPAFVSQAAMIRNFLGRGTVESVLVPYSCLECGQEKEVLVEISPGGPPPVREELDCGCGAHLEIDVLPEVYFSFLENDG
jgi:hypothetical protein